MKTKTLRWFNVILLTSLLGLALGSCGGSSSNDPPTGPTTSTISGTVAGTEIVAVNDNGAIVASDDTTGKTADPITGNFPFTLTGIPVGTNIRVYLTTASGVYPLYFDSTGSSGVANTNVFSLSAVATIDLGFVDTTVVPGQAIPGTNPVSVAGVNAEAVNTDTLVIVTDMVTGAPLSGATVIIDYSPVSRQVDTTNAAGSASFTPPSGGPVTITIGISGYGIVTLIDFNLVFLDISLESPDQLDLAFIQGTVSPYTGPGYIKVNDGTTEECPSCQDLWNGTLGFYRFGIEDLNRQHTYSAFDTNGGGAPTKFIAVTGVGPLVAGQTLTVDLTFPDTPPATTTTRGTITMPASLGTIYYSAAFGLSDLGDQGELHVGFSPWGGSASPYSYTLTTFEFTGGISDNIEAMAGGTGGASFAIRRGVGFGDTGMDITLIDVPTILLPNGGGCDGIAPTFSWTAVPGASFYFVTLADIPSGWWNIFIDGGSTSFDLPDLTGTPIAVLGLSLGVPISWEIEATVAPGYNFNTLNNEDVLTTDSSEAGEAICTP